MKTLYNVFALLWRVPGFVFSFLFYRSTRLLILSAAQRAFDRQLKRREKLEWTAYSESLQIPGALPYLMCTTSRWNPHAPLGSFGPLDVEGTLEIEVGTAIASARGWIITVFRGDFEVVALLYPGNTDEKTWKILQLPKDRYRVLVRYYGDYGTTILPAIKADGQELTASRNVGDEMQKSLDFFTKNVVNRKGFFYFLTQYYIFQLLRWQDNLPPQLVRRLYLPVGDPQITTYRYGVIKKGQQLNLSFDLRLLEKADVYVTYCNRWGFPAFWDNVKEGEFFSRVVPQDVVYLVRVVNFFNRDPLNLDDYQFSCRVLQHRATAVAHADAGKGSSRQVAQG